MTFDPLSLSVALVKVVAGPLIKKAWERLKSKGSTKDSQEIEMGPEEVDRVFVIPEIGRPIANSIIKKFKLDETKVVKITYDRALSPKEIHLVAGEIHRALDELQLVADEIILLVPGPMPLAFILGQYTGMGFLNIKLLWIQGKKAFLLKDGHLCRKPMFKMSEKEIQNLKCFQEVKDFRQLKRTD